MQIQLVDGLLQCCGNIIESYRLTFKANRGMFVQYDVLEGSKLLHQDTLYLTT